MKFKNFLVDLAMAGYDLAEQNRRNAILNGVGDFGHQGLYINDKDHLKEFDSTASERRALFEKQLH